jgi:alkylation response protein AidB-like acyl-CoA dehydrogenase
VVTEPFADDDPASRLSWIRAHRADLADVPFPGSGDTPARWRTLARLGATDGSLARLAEGHLDALAILAELGRTSDASCIYGVWAARPAELSVRPDAGGWWLRGVKPWSSGASRLDRALVTATDPDGGVRLFDVAVARLRFADDWRPPGMRASDSRTACVDLRVDADAQVGAVGAYVERPGFWHGGAGVAACWHGLAGRVGRDLAAQAATSRDDPYLATAAGRAAAALAASSALLAAAGRQIDAGPGDTTAARHRATTVRVAIEQVCRMVLETSLGAQGATALCFDEAHAHAVADLTVYLAQLHPGHDAAAVRADDDDDLWWSP